MNSQNALVDQLTAAGKVPAAWAPSFAAVDRAMFIPSRCWVNDHKGHPRPLDRRTDTDAWEAAVYSDVPIVIQLDDGHTVWPATSSNATSSASQPGIVLEMLGLLDVESGHNVLEIGSGTGYNAGLLAHRLGDERVTSVELDDGIAEQAAAALESVGHKPEVVWADGEQGWEPNAPYDRIISTASVVAGQFPTAWVAQSRSGGKILTPWKTVWGSGALVRLTTQAGTAEGPVISDAYFMNLRSQRTPYGHAGRFGHLADNATDVPITTTAVPPDDVALNANCSFAVGLRTYNIQHSVARDTDDTYELLVYDVATESWATVRVNPGSTAAGVFEVRQGGPRRLWREVEEAHAWWVESGKPIRTRFGITVTPTSQTAWLDSPHNTVITFP